MSKVSIIMPSLNVKKYICQCMDSVINQTLKDIEIICIDAGSTDGTIDILKDYEKKDKRIHLVFSEKKSYGYQVNTGIDLAKSKYIGIVETDDFVKNNMFEQLYDIAEKNSVDFIKADFYRFTENFDGTLLLQYNKLSSSENNYNKIINIQKNTAPFNFIMNTWSGIYNINYLRKWNIKHNESPGASYQDIGFWFQTFCYSERAYFYNKPFYMNRRDNPNSSVYDSSKIYCKKNEFDYINNIILNNKKLLYKYLPINNFFRFAGYFYADLKIISKQALFEYLINFSIEFKQIINKCEIDSKWFSKFEWDNLIQIVYNPRLYYIKMLADKNNINLQNRILSEVDDRIMFSIIIPGYNVEKYISECLDSILIQKYTNYEILCIDDGSTDNTYSILCQYAKKNNCIKVFHQNNNGVASARNLGLNNAVGLYILFIDSDDSISYNALNTLNTIIKKYKSDIIIFGSNFYDTHINNNKKMRININNPVRNINYKIFISDILFKEPGTRPYVWRNCYKHELLNKNGITFLSDCLIGEDTIFQFISFPKAKNITFIKNKLYNYRLFRNNSLMSTFNKNPLLKSSYHIKIVSYLFNELTKTNEFEKMKIDFINWSINFVYNEMTPLSTLDKIDLSKDIVNIIENNTVEKNFSKLGINTKERFNELRNYSKLNKEIQINSCTEDLLENIITQIKISFIVPAYNVEKYIYNCIMSLLNQTLLEIEVICIDDASTDDTPSILNELSKSDNRLKIITFYENMTANQARKEGVLKSAGEFILFCDADDTFNIDAAEKLYNEMKNNDFDIIHFGTNIDSIDNDENDKNWLNKNLKPYFGTLYNKNVFEGCFRENLFSATLFNKIYKSSTVKKAFSHVEDIKLERGQDLYAFVLISYYANSYKGLVANYFYNYNLGSGGDGKISYNYEQFIKFCTFNKVVTAIKNFFIKEEVFNLYEDIYISIRSKMVGDCMNKWFNKVLYNDKGKCLNILLQSWPDWMIIENIVRKYWNNKDEIIDIINTAEIKRVKNKVITIGMYYHKLINGGVEKVIQFLTPIYISIGYKVVLITDIQGPEDYISLPSGVKRYMIPNQGQNNYNNYNLRAKELSDIIHNEKIDVIIYHAWNTEILLWDMLLIKAAGSSFIVYCHSIFSIRLITGSSYFAKIAKIFSLADAIVCLSDIDKCFWSYFNQNVYVVLNPPTFNIIEAVPSDLSTRNIIWVGRLSVEKRPEDALYIFEKVFKQIPDSKLNIVGSAEDNNYFSNLKKIVSDLRMQNNVTFYGYCEDIELLYRQSSILLSTSEYEGFSINIFEGKSFGLPIVMYDLPYLTLAIGNRGILSSKLGDFDCSANHIINLLSDNNLKYTLGAQSRNHALELAQYNYKETWNNIFKSLENDIPYNDKIIETKMWDVIFSHYMISINKNTNMNNLYNILKNENKKRSIYLRIILYPFKMIKMTYQYIKINGVKKTFIHISYKSRDLISIMIKILKYIKKNGCKATIEKIKQY